MVRSLAVWSLAFACAVAPVAAVCCLERCEVARVAERVTPSPQRCHGGAAPSGSATRMADVHRCAHDHGATPALRAPRSWASAATRADLDAAALVAHEMNGARPSLHVRDIHGPPSFRVSRPRTDSRLVLRV